MLARISTVFDCTDEQFWDKIIEPKSWNHTIRFHPFGAGQLRYTDAIEIQAGLLTIFIWAFAHLFYRYRQRRWKELLASEGRPT